MLYFILYKNTDLPSIIDIFFEKERKKENT